MEMLLNAAKFMLESKWQGLCGIKHKCQLAARQGIGREVKENIPAQADAMFLKNKLINGIKLSTLIHII